MNLQLFIGTIFFGMFCLPVSSGQAVHRSSWQEFCNETIKCDKTAWLTCKSSSCVCLLEDMVFSAAESKCLSKPGERCRFQIMDVTSENKDVALYGNTECVAHANCANGFTCACDSGFYETVNGGCDEQKDANATCVAHVECKTSKFLKCLEGVCGCAPDRNYIYAVPNKNTVPMCVVGAGKPMSPPGVCVNGTLLQNGLCVCVPEIGFYAGEDGHCHPRKDLGQLCTENVECQFDRKFLTCVDGKCGCDPIKFTFQRFLVDKIGEVEEERQVLGHNNNRPDYADDEMFYAINPPSPIRGRWLRGEPYGHGFIAVKVNKTIQESGAQCVGLAAKPCNPESNCIRDSKCSLATPPNASTCVCTPENELYAANGTCHKKRGVSEPCSGDEECLFEGRFLTCVNGTCGCEPSKYFYLRLSAGDLVSLDVEIQVRGYLYSRPPSRPVYGQGYFTENGTEVYGEMLREDGYSSVIRATHIQLQEDREQCVGLAQRNCNPESMCVQNAACQKSTASGNVSCACVSGYSPTSNGLCGIGHGGACTHFTPCSDSFRCTNGTCDCPMLNHQIYNAAERRCFALALSPCCSDSECVPNSVCVINPETGGQECRCAVGFVENSRGTCERAWGSRCNYSDEVPCDSVAGLRCRNEICSCPDTRMYFNSTTRGCQGLVGSRCTSPQVHFKFCVTGASCVMHNYWLGGQCRCGKNFVVNTENLCDLDPSVVTSTPNSHEIDTDRLDDYQ